MTGPYAVYYTLYESVARGLIEESPSSTDWESSKRRINEGEIATMVLGSWAVEQCKEAALKGEKTLDEIMAEWNEKWTSGQEAVGVEITQ